MKPQEHSDMNRGRAVFHHTIGLENKLPPNSATSMAMTHCQSLNIMVSSNQKMVRTNIVTCMFRCRKIMLWQNNSMNVVFATSALCPADSAPSRNASTICFVLPFGRGLPFNTKIRIYCYLQIFTCFMSGTTMPHEKRDALAYGIPLQHDNALVCAAFKSPASWDGS